MSYQQKQEHKHVNWLIRYSIQDVGLKYLHLSTVYGTHVQSLIESCERHMAKETKGIKSKVHRKSKHWQGTGQTEPNPVQEGQKSGGGGITPNLISFHSKIHSKAPLNGTTQRLHSMTRLLKKQSAEGKSRLALCNLWSEVMEWSLGVERWSGVLEWILGSDFEFLSPFYDRIVRLTDRQRQSGVGSHFGGNQ